MRMEATLKVMTMRGHNSKGLKKLSVMAAHFFEISNNECTYRFKRF